MREVELKAVLDDWARRAARLTEAGAVLAFAGRLEDRRYDTPLRDLARRDEVLRLRIYRDASGARAELGWKGPTGYEGGYKVREELQCNAQAPDVLATMLARLGYEVTRAIDREIAQYALRETTVRFERYPRMDDLVEVEGPPDGIERAIVALGMDRAAFTTERLPQFVMRWQLRTGQSAALCDDELAGRRRYALEDA
ncbi:MAG TPA: class IV adenylate cyclase [Gemmatimonadaceae bacterium]|nr:class IV adenylate cyclase [Gemmatimonadaceae bacterium]